MKKSLFLFFVHFVILLVFFVLIYKYSSSFGIGHLSWEEICNNLPSYVVDSAVAAIFLTVCFYFYDKKK